MILKNASFTKAALLFLSFFISSETALASIVQLPQTGQTTSYYPGDDANIPSGVPWPNPRFSSGGTGCRIDNLTGLTWAQNGNLPGVQKTWEEALAYITTLNAGVGICGHTDWRLPNLNELATLINANEPNSATWLNAAGQGFNSVQAAEYWTSTTNAHLTPDAWTVHLWEGTISYTSKSSYRYILPVRGTTSGPALVPATGQTVPYSATGGEDGDLKMGVPLPNPRFQDNGDGTATDMLTGLVWLQDANCILTNYPTFDAGGSYGPATIGRVIWDRALDFIAGMNDAVNRPFPLCDGGHHDWRLPNRNELRSFMDYGPDSSDYYGSLMPTYGFSNIQLNDYWSSTTRAGDTSDSMVLDTWYNAIETAGKTVFRYVWPVRSAPKIQVTPSPSFDYGFVYVDDTKIHTFTITNVGSADLVLGPLDIPFMTRAEYLFFNDFCSNATLAPGESCTIDIAIQPQDSGLNDAQLEIGSNDLNTGLVSIGLIWYGDNCVNSSVATYNALDIQNGAFNDIQSAYNNSGTTDNTVIKVRMIYFSGAVVFPQPSNPGKIVTLKGGYDCAFFASTYYSTIVGSLTIRSGQVTIENIVIQ